MSSAMADKKDRDDSSFICGVVEGFYGRPWTTEQRKDLFTKLQVKLLDISCMEKSRQITKSYQTPQRILLSFDIFF